MLSPEASHLDHREVKKKITKQLLSSLHALQMRYVSTDDAITSDDDDANRFCVALEAVFIHGLKIKYVKTAVDKRRMGHRVLLPQPAFWPLLKAVTHRNVITHLETISYITSDVGRCRAWLRLALNESLMECYFLTLQREKSHLLEYYQPFALLMDAEDCDVVFGYLQGLSALTFSLSHKSSVLNEWTVSPLTLSGLWLEEAECFFDYKTNRRKSLDSVSQSSGSDEANNSTVSNSKLLLKSSSLSLDNSSFSSQLSSSLGSDEPPLNHTLEPPSFSMQFKDACDDVETSCIGIKNKDAGTSDTSMCSLYNLHLSQILQADKEHKETLSCSSEATSLKENLQDQNIMVSESLSSPPTSVYLVDADCVTVPFSNRCLSAETSPPTNITKTRCWISEDDFHDESQLPHVAGSGILKSPDIPFHVVHRRQIGLPNPFRGLLMLGSLYRKNALGLYKPYYCELTPYEFRLHVEGDDQNCSECCSLFRCESVGSARNDGRFDLQFANKQLHLKAPSKGEAQDWVDRIKEAMQKIRSQKDDSWEILHCQDFSQSSLLPSDCLSSCQVFDWKCQVEEEPDALKESVLYMKVDKLWTRLIFSLSEKALKSFLPRSMEKALYNVYTIEMVKDILPDSSLGNASCFRLVTTKGSLQLQAENAAEAKSWRELVRAVFMDLEGKVLQRTSNVYIKPDIRDHLLFEYLLHIPTEQGLDKQNFKCAGCHKKIGFQFGKAKLCAFSGLYYCDLCHQDEKSVIPSRIVHNWDLMERAVSRPAMNFLKMIQDEPIFNLKSLNDRLYQHTHIMCEISHSREKLRLLAEYLITCRSGALQELSTSLDHRNYLLDYSHYYSLHDFKQIIDGTFQFCLHSALEFSSSHVYTCELCSQRGFICQVCNQKDIIYPFQFETTTRCGNCKAVFHKPCKTPGTLCPQCERRRKYQDQQLTM